MTKVEEKQGRVAYYPWYRQFAAIYIARQNCIDRANHEWAEKHDDSIRKLIDMLPSGSGLDNGWELDNDRTTGERITLRSAYHFMNDAGYYDGWGNFSLIITPSLAFGVVIKIVGNFGKYQDVKEYLYDILHDAITREVEE